MPDVFQTITGGFFDSVNKDRLYSADQMNMPYKKLITDGIILNENGTGSPFEVTAADGMTVNVGPGNALIGGKWAENEETILVEISGNTSGAARIDSIILRIDKSLDVRAVGIVYRQGAATAPDLEASADVKEFRLANITVVNNAVSITAANITDTRGGSECPYVTSIFDPPEARYIIEEYNGSELAGAHQTVKSAFDTIRYAAQSGQPTVALQAADMTEYGKVYLYEGSEDGYDTGYLYYYSATDGAWIRGAQYGASVVDTSLDANSENPVQNKAVAAALTEVNGRLVRQESAIDFQRKEPDAVTENWAVTNEGYAIVNNDYTVYKYLVTPGEEIFCIAPTPAGAKASYAFTDGLNISQSNLDHIVGTPSTTAVNGKVTVPEGAVYIFFSCLKTDTTSGIYASTVFSDMDNRIDSVSDELSDVSMSVYKEEHLDSWSMGTFHSTNGGTYASDSRIRANKSLSFADGYMGVSAADGYCMRIFAYDQTGTYVGVYLTTGTFGKNWSNNADVTEFSFVEYPAYVFKIVALKTENPEEISTDDGQNISVKRSVALANSAAISGVISSTDELLNGFTRSIDAQKADDGKSYGLHDISGVFYPGTTVTARNNNLTNNNWTIYVKAGDTVIQQVAVSQNTEKTFTIAQKADKIRIYCNVYPISGSITYSGAINGLADSVNVLKGYHGTVDNIVDMNYKVPTLLKSAQKLLYGQTVVPLSLLHFSDTHGAKANVTRMIEMANALGTSIDDVICTGDMVNNKYADGYAWWGEITGAENILTCIGNHDISDGESYNQYGVTAEEAYNTYFAPYIDNWNVEHTGTNTYYYKDYQTKNIRLIVLDYLLTGDAATAQNTWLQTALSGAKTAGYTVVIAQHCPVSNFSKINSNFTIIANKTPYQYPVIYQQSVQSFIDGGGDFACFIAGHTHWDMLCINPDYPNQICICVTCAITTGRDNDQIREGGTKSQDAGNVVTIDTTTKTIKLIRVGADTDNYLRLRNTLTISYADKTIFADG